MKRLLFALAALVLLAAPIAAAITELSQAASIALALMGMTVFAVGVLAVVGFLLGLERQVRPIILYDNRRVYVQPEPARLGQAGQISNWVEGYYSEISESEAA